MTVHWVRLTEVCAQLHVDDELLSIVRAEGFLEIKETVESEPVISPEDAERLRLITVLVRELDVNLAGVEVILHMHADLCSMQQQFDTILQTLVRELRQRVGGA
ncbi:MAG: chaperone modulator CbpM [bacterium]